MKLAPLHARFIEAFSSELPGWKFIQSRRHFQQKFPGHTLLIHIAFINHVEDFDATIAVAVEFLAGRKRACIIGAELGNIEGKGQFRHSVVCATSADSAARDALAHLKRVGFPFMERFSQPSNVLATLKAGGAAAWLISPLAHLHNQQIAALESIEIAVGVDQGRDDQG
jgi:hypothetical protein